MSKICIFDGYSFNALVSFKNFKNITAKSQQKILKIKHSGRKYFNLEFSSATERDLFILGIESLNDHAKGMTTPINSAVKPI